MTWPNPTTPKSLSDIERLMLEGSEILKSRDFYRGINIDKNRSIVENQYFPELIGEYYAWKEKITKFLKTKKVKFVHLYPLTESDILDTRIADVNHFDTAQQITIKAEEAVRLASKIYQQIDITISKLRDLALQKGAIPKDKSKKIKLIVSDVDGVYVHPNKDIKYAVTGKRYNILKFLNVKNHTASQLKNLLYKGSTLMPAKEITGREGINEKFNKFHKLGRDLIIQLASKEYMLNREKYDIKFDDHS